MLWLDRLCIAVIAVLARGAVVLWAAGKLAPAADGIYYHRLASRLAEGSGYTWLWPDGVVTPAAHYPVGYPFLLSLVYRITGPLAATGALLNLVLGVLGVLAVHDLTARFSGRRAGILAGLLAALDPAMVLYTPALMTEGIAASLLAIAAALVGAAVTAERRGGGWIAAGLVLGVATLVRPQCLLVAPLFGFFAPLYGDSGQQISILRSSKRWIRGAVLTGVTLLVCLPWTVRNCVKMDRCVMVSANGGWNLLIGTNTKAGGHWAPVETPDACKEVFPEVAKDVCFGQAARQRIMSEPGAWLRLIPAKLASTFDYCGAGPWYLHDAAPEDFSYDAKVRAGTLETLVRRLMLAAVLVALARGQGRWAGGIALLGIGFTMTHHGWLAMLFLAVLAWLRWRKTPDFFPAAALGAVLWTTLLVHAVFFGAGRYGLVVFPMIATCTGALLTAVPWKGDTEKHAAD